MAVVIAGADQVPQMIDDAGADKRRAFVIERDAPRVTRPLAENLELPRHRMNAKHRARELPAGMLGFVIWIFRGVFDVAEVEHAVEAV